MNIATFHLHGKTDCEEIYENRIASTLNHKNIVSEKVKSDGRSSTIKSKIPAYDFVGIAG